MRHPFRRAPGALFRPSALSFRDVFQSNFTLKLLWRRKAKRAARHGGVGGMYFRRQRRSERFKMKIL
jgi:hypothetical protein